MIINLENKWTVIPVLCDPVQIGSNFSRFHLSFELFNTVAVGLLSGASSVPACQSMLILLFEL